MKLYQEKIMDANQSTKEGNDNVIDKVAISELLEDDVKRLETKERMLKTAPINQ